MMATTVAPEMIPTTDTYARNILRSYQDRVRSQLPPGKGLPVLRGIPRKAGQEVSICIIGGGAAGLFAALTIERLKEKGHNLKYTILEAEPETKPNDEPHPLGGRLWTKKFSGAGAGENDYYDRGAMRFPDIPIMKPTFALFEYLGITKGNGLIDYVMSTDNNLSSFNGKTLSQTEINELYAKDDFDPFKTNIAGLTNQPNDMVLAKIGSLRDAVKAGDIGPVMDVDHMSTRTYMLSGEGNKPYSNDIVTYLESMQLGSNMYDASITETVMESLDFDYWGGKMQAPWHCVQGGVGVIVEKMAEHIPKENIKNGMRVTALAPAFKHGSPDVEVTCGHSASPDPVRYNHVISTMPLSCLSMVDMFSYEPNWRVSTALRTLSYGPSTKVGIRFTSRWWENLEAPGPGQSQTGVKNQLGGVTATDRPTRIVVYPSYGIGSTTGATMLVSYSWAQDALRLGALCQGHGSEQEERLKGLILRDLAAIHGVDQGWLAKQVEEYDAWAWYSKEDSAGAFAFFNPGQFSDLYVEVTQPVLGSLHFAGEATSIHHAWVVGALNSAFRTLIEIAHHEGNTQMIKDLLAFWPDIKEFDPELIGKQVALGQNR